MKKIDVSICLTNPQGAGLDDICCLSITDSSAKVEFAKLYLPYAELTKALMSSQGRGEATVRELDKVGKKMEMDRLEFPFDERDFEFCDREEAAYDKALALCPEGWEPSGYFGSQSSFGTDKDGNKVARCTIRRWIDERVC